MKKRELIALSSLNLTANHCWVFYGLRYCLAPPQTIDDNYLF